MALAGKLRDPYSLATACFANEMIFSAKGDWPAARDFGNRGLEASSWDTRSWSLEYYSNIRWESVANAKSICTDFWT
jgi:hypothetical protein